MENSDADVQIRSWFDDIIEESLGWEYWETMQIRNEEIMNKGSSKGNNENGTELNDILKLDSIRLVPNWFNIRKIYCSYQAQEPVLLKVCNSAETAEV